MPPVTTTPPVRGSRGVFRGVLTGVLLVAAVIVGLLGMHTLNLHGTAAADAPAAVSIAAAGPESGHHVGAPSHGSGDTSGALDTSCAGCGSDDHAGMAMMCVLALLLVLLILLPPRALRGWTANLLPRPVAEGGTALLLPRAPSLHVLCISRT